MPLSLVEMRGNRDLLVGHGVLFDFYPPLFSCVSSLSLFLVIYVILLHALVFGGCGNAVNISSLSTGFLVEKASLQELHLAIFQGDTAKVMSPCV